ncbi:MAG: redoxin domain-containing protein [Deltaproteobacteria bacterium]|nr:redoxin domain-containing protein [Deltaproteobacteria bacterium]
MPTARGCRLVLALFALWLPAAGCAVHAGEPGARAVDAGAPPPAPGRLHALLLNGGGRKEINYRSHLHHIRRAWELLRAGGVPAGNIAVFSADGADPAPDLATRETDDARGFWVLPQWTQNALRAPITYVDSTIAGVTLLRATKDALRGWFAEAKARLGPGDTLLLYVTDHGEKNEKDLKDNTISLWNDKLSVTELREMLAVLDPGVRVVMLMSQCFSGSFAQVVHPDADATPVGNVCGYFSTTADRRAYGCYPENRGKDGIGHAHHFLEAVAGLDRFPAAERSVLVTDRTPDIPNTTLDVFLAARLTKAAQAAGRRGPDASPERAMAALADELLAEAWRDRGAWEPDIRLLDRIGASFGTFSPRSLGELEEQARVLPEFSSRLATYAERWNQAFDALKIEILREFVRDHPVWKPRLEAAALKALDADGRRKTLYELLAELVPFASADPARHARLKLLKRKAADAAAASYRAEVRLGAVLRLRTHLTSMAGRVYMTTRATPEERASYERLAACEDLALGGPIDVAAPAALATGESFPPLAEERRLVEELMPAYMGIYFRPLDEAQRRKWNIGEGAVAVMTVNPDSPAKAAGLQVGDVILGPPGALFTEPTQVREWTMRSEIGVDYALATLRDGVARTVTLRPGPYPLELPKLPGPPKVGSVAPTMDLDVIRGEDQLATDRSDLLYFWATWCVICKHALPEIMAYAKARHLDLIAITDEDPELVRRFLADQKEPFPEIVAIDAHRATFQGYGVSGTPSFVIVDPDGVVRLYQTGYTVDGGLHVDGWTFNGRKRAAAPSPAPTPIRKP